MSSTVANARAADVPTDHRNAITWLSEHPGVDPARIGIWETSLRGGVVLHTATFDKRIKAVVVQAPSAVNWESRRSVDPERFDRLGRSCCATASPATGPAPERAAKPRSRVVLPCGHFEIHDGQWGEKAAGAAAEWFRGRL